MCLIIYCFRHSCTEPLFTVRILQTAFKIFFHESFNISDKLKRFFIKAFIFIFPISIQTLWRKIRTLFVDFLLYL